MTTETADPQRKISYPADFTVEFGDDTNRTMTLSTIKKRLRGHWSISKLFAKEGGGADPGRMSAMPDTPGIRCSVSPRSGKVEFFDPLESEPKLLENINHVLNRGSSHGGKVTFVPRKKQVLDADRMKTFCRELMEFQKYGKLHAITKGRLPTQDEYEAMPGHRLHDPASSNVHKPIYEKDYMAWARRISQPGAAV